MPENHRLFTKTLLDWYDPKARPLPWKGEDNPYFIWLSEIILQQTRVEQGRDYYIKFKEHYPTVHDLADAPEDELMKHWEGLGYYSRARNLHTAAKHISKELNGEFPDTYKDILALKGVGPYTAAAISSFAFNLPHAVVDGNVYRVLARYFGIDEPTDTTSGKKRFAQLADDLLNPKKPGIYNQAIMDFGATVCKPKAALCNTCPLRESCYAIANENVYDLPVKSKKLKKKTRHFHYLFLNKNEKVFIRKRVTNDIWRNLYETPLLETTPDGKLPEVLDIAFIESKTGYSGLRLVRCSKPFKQELTHRTIWARFYEVEVSDHFFLPENEGKEIERSEIRNFAFPKIIDCYLNDNSLYLF